MLAIILQGRGISQKAIAIGNSQGNHPKAFNPSEGTVGERTTFYTTLTLYTSRSIYLDLGICTIRKKNEA